MPTKTQYKEYFDLQVIVKEIKNYLPNFNEEKFVEAFEFAAQAHSGQMRKDGETPYIVHPVRVVEILKSYHADEDILIAALLHDVPEDTPHGIPELKKLFGSQVAFLVEGITKLSKVQYHNNMPERDVESLKKLFLHSAKDPRVIVIKLADRLHNMRTLQFIDRADKRLRIARETLEIFVPMANLLGIQGMKSELEDLCFQHLFPPEYNVLKSKVLENKMRNRKVARKFVINLKKYLEEGGIMAEIYERNKNLYSIYKKLCAQGKSIENMENRIAIRIIVQNISQCYQALGIVHSSFIPELSRFKDYIANPKTNGYQSLHTSIFGPSGILTDVQIKTAEMHLEAEYGIAANFFHNKNEKLKSDKRSLWVNNVVEIEKAMKGEDNFLENLKGDVFQDRMPVFTPKGKVIDLPKGASALDFAYAVHTDVGNHAHKANINGVDMPITTTLHSRDVCGIIKSMSTTPELSWLSFVKTNFAKDKIKNYLKKTSKEKRIRDGQKILQKEFDIAGLGLIKKFSFKKLKGVIEREFAASFNDWSEVMVSIGEGSMRAGTLVKAIMRSGKPEFEENMKKAEGEKVCVKVVAKNRFGLLKEIADVFYKHSYEMNYLKAWESNSHDYAYFTTKILVDDLSKVGRAFEELEQMDDVIQVYRVSYRGLYQAVSLAILTSILWISHPFILKTLMLSVIIENTLLFNLIVNMALLTLMFMVIYFTQLLKVYFPLVRKTVALWIISFAIPSAAVMVLLTEVFYFNLELSWIALAIEVMMIYTYLVISFRNFRKLI